MSNDKLKIHCEDWCPDSGVKAAICFVHGHGEHFGRYSHVVKAFNDAGYAVVGFDLRGHGKSGGQRGHSPSIDSFMSDIEMLLSETKKRYPNIPCFLHGHSLGGLLVINFMLRRKPELAGAVITAPGLRPLFPISKWKVSACSFLCKFFPAFPVSTGLESDYISSDPEVVDAYKKDILVHSNISARSGFDILEMGEWALSQAAEMSLPILLTHGTGDRTTSVEATREFAASAGEKCTLKLWEGLYHEIHNEPQKAEVLSFIIAWLDERINVS